MAEQLIFKKAVLKSFGRSSDGGHATFHSEITNPVLQALGWGYLESWQTKAGLDGELHATRMVFSPAEGALAKYQIEMEVTRVRSFSAVRLELKGSKKRGFRFELRFIVDFADKTGCRYLEEYITSAGGHGELLVHYVKQAALPGTEEDQPEKQLPLS